MSSYPQIINTHDSISYRHEIAYPVQLNMESHLPHEAISNFTIIINTHDSINYRHEIAGSQNQEWQTTPEPPQRGTMEQKDRRSCLPDDVLQSILRKLSLKQAVRTGALSRWWESQWIRALASSPVVDLTDDPDFARGQPPALSAATVDRCLRLHTELGAPLDMFRVALVCPSDLDGQDVIGWIATGLRRGARAVEVDLAPPPPEEEDEEEEGEEEEDPHAGHEAPLLELPADLFQARNSLERLALGSFSLHAVPLPAVGLAGLRSLSLSHVDVTDEALRGLVANCPALERLSLRRCSRLAMVSVASETLRVLELVGCQALKQLCVDAPALESFALHCNIFVTNPDAPCEWDWDTPVEVDLLGPPALRDVYLSHIGCDTRLDTEHNALYPSLCLDVVLARILTICSIGLLVRTENHNAHKLIRSVTIYSCGSDQHVDSLSWLDPFKDMPNLEELQLLMDYEGYCLEAVSGFFKLIPLPVLQRLFVCVRLSHFLGS
jgi:hypothetical protein